MLLLDMLCYKTLCVFGCHVINCMLGVTVMLYPGVCNVCMGCIIVGSAM